MCKKKSASIVIWKIHEKPFQPLLSLPSKRAVIQKILQKLQTINFKYGVSPGKWFIFDAGEFDTARPRAASECCMEVIAQVRANGRVMEHWRIVTRGTAHHYQENQALPTRAVNTASIRWAVCISEKSRLEIQLQCLPASAATLSAKPVFKR